MTTRALAASHALGPLALAGILLASTACTSEIVGPGADAVDAAATAPQTDAAGADAAGEGPPEGGADAHPASPDATPPDAGPPPRALKTVFLIVMENHDWSQVQGQASAPYINHTLLPMGAYATQYMNPPGLHPSEPNYLWLEAGSNLGVGNDADPPTNHRATTAHLSTRLRDANISWRSYQEGIDGTACPIHSFEKYAAKHNPFVFFDDTNGFDASTGGFNSTNAYCIAHVRPYQQLAVNLAADINVAHYNFITPDLCHDGHNSSGCATSDPVKNEDNWLASEIPKILASHAYQDGGVVFITWDEGANNSDGPIGLIVLSPDIKAPGYSNDLPYTHSSTLRTVQEILGIAPMLGDAANASSLADLFAVYP